jgi:hypothetical protein
MNTHKETVTLILTKDLKMKATYAKMVTENHSGWGGGGMVPKLRISLKRQQLVSHERHFM